MSTKMKNGRKTAVAHFRNPNPHTRSPQGENRPLPLRMGSAVSARRCHQAFKGPRGPSRRRWGTATPREDKFSRKNVFQTSVHVKPERIVPPSLA